jgi:hypothetical protein
MIYEWTPEQRKAVAEQMISKQVAMPHRGRGWERAQDVIAWAIDFLPAPKLFGIQVPEWLWRMGRTWARRAVLNLVEEIHRKWEEHYGKLAKPHPGRWEDRDPRILIIAAS